MDDYSTDGLEHIRNSAERRRAALARARASYDRRAMREYVAHEVFAETEESLGAIAPAQATAARTELGSSAAVAVPAAMATATAPTLPLPEPRRRVGAALLGRRVTQRWTEAG